MKGVLIGLSIFVALGGAGCATAGYFMTKDSNGGYVMQEKTYDLNNETVLSDVKIKDINSNVTITTHEEESIVINYEESSKYTYEINLSATGELSIEAKDLRKWYEKFISIDFFDHDLIVSLPLTYQQKIDVKAVSGSISLENINLATDVKLETTSGNINFANSECVNLEAKTATGSVRLNMVTVSNNFKGISISGNVSMMDSHIKNVNVESTSGSIRHEKTVSEVVVAKTISGYIKSLDGSFTTLDGSSTSGNLTVTTTQKPTKIDFKSVSGGAKITLPSDCGYVVNYSSTSGSYRSEFEETTKYHFGDEALKITFASTSGGCHISK